MSVRPCREIPQDGTRSSLRVRVRVDGAPVGIGLLNADKSAFVQSRRLLPSIEGETVWLPVDDPVGGGPLVVHAWDILQPARVVIEDISWVW
jgi:hypothetical protein